VLTASPQFQGFIRILESVGYGQLHPVFEGADLFPLGTGDADQDGKSDLVGLGGAGRLQVYESVNENSHPSVLAWESPLISNHLGFGTYADTDADGQIEIVYLFSAGPAFRVTIFECAGDNAYVQKFLSVPKGITRPEASVQTIYNPWVDDDLVFDLDQDGRAEISSGGEGRLEIFESTGNDAWEEIFTDSTELVNARIVAGGVDSDGDGVRELFLGGEDGTTFERKIFVYQPTGDRTFARIGTLTAFDDATGSQWGTFAQLEPDGQIRFVWALYRQLRIYVASGPGQWVLERIIPDPAPPHLAVYAYDLNRNGRDEIYWLTNAQTRTSLILERPTLPTDASSNQSRIGGTIRVTPSPCRSNATVFLDPTTAVRAAEWSAFDAAGRLVFRQSLDSNVSRTTWVMPADRLGPGLYFLRVTDVLGRPIATGRTTVVR